MIVFLRGSLDPGRVSMQLLRTSSLQMEDLSSVEGELPVIILRSHRNLSLEPLRTSLHVDHFLTFSSVYFPYFMLQVHKDDVGICWEQAEKQCEC